MRFEVDRFREFYASPLGGMVRERLASRVSALWPSVSGLDVLGFGYAEPVLAGLGDDARRVISASPGEMGVERWPQSDGCRSVGVDEDRFPFKEALFDRVIVMHGLEEAESARQLLREIWRISAPEARILFIVANRRGLWARAESTPMGHGRPYTRTQLRRLLSDSMFQLTASSWAVCAPPINWRPIASAGETWDRVGGYLWSGFSGVLLVEAVKRVVAEPGAPVAAAARQPHAVRASVRSAQKSSVDENPVDNN